MEPEKFSTKLKNALKGTVKYVRELSIVVAGIAITFTVSDCINKKNEKEDLQKYLNTLIVEMEENLAIMEEKGRFYDGVLQLGLYLMKTPEKEYNTDSIEAYDRYINHGFIMNYKTGAFEMLKTSGMMRLIDDKQLLSSISTCYSTMQQAKDESDMYTNLKMSLFNEVIEEDDTHYIMDFKDPRNKKLLRFFRNNSGLEVTFWEAADEIKQILSVLTKKQ